MPANGDTVNRNPKPSPSRSAMLASEGRRSLPPKRPTRQTSQRTLPVYDEAPSSDLSSVEARMQNSPSSARSWTSDRTPSQRSLCSNPSWAGDTQRTPPPQSRRGQMYETPERPPPLPRRHDSRTGTRNIQPASSPRKYIEVSPGVSVILRGAQETYKSVFLETYLPAVCFSCTIELGCVPDAEFVLCPICRVVSPLHVKEGDTTKQGVGLGFTMQQATKWQTETDPARKREIINGGVIR